MQITKNNTCKNIEKRGELNTHSMLFILRYTADETTIPNSDVVQLRRDFTHKHAHFFCSGDKKPVICCSVYSQQQNTLYMYFST